MYSLFRNIRKGIGFIFWMGELKYESLFFQVTVGNFTLPLFYICIRCILSPDLFSVGTSQMKCCFAVQHGGVLGLSPHFCAFSSAPAGFGNGFHWLTSGFTGVLNLYVYVYVRFVLPSLWLQSLSTYLASGPEIIKNQQKKNKFKDKPKWPAGGECKVGW